MPKKSGKRQAVAKRLRLVIVSFCLSFFFSRKKRRERKRTKKRGAAGDFAVRGDKGSAPLTAPPFEKGGRKLSRLGVAVDVYSLSPLA